jgi:hypothetical protein
MADVFISYKREDQAEARALSELIEGGGVSVWWDRELLAGDRFDETIENELKVASCVVVIWSARSVQSQYVRDEATYALNRSKCIPISIDGVTPPFRFQSLHTLQIASPIQGDRSNLVKDALLEAIRVHCREGAAEAILSTEAHSTEAQLTRDEGDIPKVQPPTVPEQPQSFAAKSMSALRSLLPSDANERLQSYTTITAATLRKHGYTNLKRNGLYWTGTTGVFERTAAPDRFSLKIRCVTPLQLNSWKPVADKRCEEEAHGYALANGYRGFTVIGFRIAWLSTALGMGPDITYEVQFERPV